MPLWFSCYQERLVNKTKPYAGIEEALALPPFDRAVLTNKPGGMAREILLRLGLSRAFARVVGGDAVHHMSSGLGTNEEYGLLVHLRFGYRPLENILESINAS